MFDTIKDVHEKLESAGYICSVQIATVVFLSYKLGKPLFVEGPAGVGKTELAKALAISEGQELIRLQCYEGLDESKALYEWEYAKQILYTQMLKEKIGDLLKNSKNLSDGVETIAGHEDAFFSPRFILPRPLLKAILSDRPSVLLIDEIDKSDPEFEAFLLEVLSDFQVSIPELGTLKAKHIPLVVLTSNDTREMSDALKRRCLHLYLDFPEPALESRIIESRVPGIAPAAAKQVVAAVNALRKMDLKKLPSISESIDWARAMVHLNSLELDHNTIQSTLATVIKHRSDLNKALENINDLARQARSATIG